MYMKRNTFFWILATLLTLSASVYQRKTGPSYPMKLSYVLNDTIVVSKLPRSGDTVDKEIDLTSSEYSSAVLHYRVYPSNDNYTNINFVKGKAYLPVQPPAGKLEYYVSIDGRDYYKDNPLVIRFKGDIAAGVLIPHIIFLFASMLFGAMTLLYALFDDRKYIKYTYLTIGALIIGGLIFGPIVQYQAFGDAWTGFPKGMDLTDNKTLIAFLFLVLAVIVQKYVRFKDSLKTKKLSRVVTILAILVLFVIFSIPHSLHGSQLNPDTGKIETER